MHICERAITNLFLQWTPKRTWHQSRTFANEVHDSVMIFIAYLTRVVAQKALDKCSRAEFNLSLPVTSQHRVSYFSSFTQQPICSCSITNRYVSFLEIYQTYIMPVFCQNSQLTNCIRQPERKLPSLSCNQNTLTTLRTSVKKSLAINELQNCSKEL